ncbi:MAG: protein rep [Bacteroidota bacterium]
MKLATSTERTKFPLQTYEKQQVTGGFGCSQNTTLDKLAQPGHHHRHRSQVSPLQKKARHVYFSKRLARNLSELDSPLHDQYRNTVTSCCTYGEQVGNKIKFKYCNARWCTTCNRVRTAKLINGYLPVINQMSDAYFVTLTRINVLGSELRHEIESLNKLFSSIVKSIRRQKIACNGIRKLECTYNDKENNFHPHFHLIVDGYDTAKMFVDRWLQRCQEQNIKADKKAQHIQKADENSTKELFKYTTKLVTSTKTDRAIYLPALDVIFQSMYGKRTFQPFGNVRMVKEDIEEIQSQEYDIPIVEHAIYVWNDNDWFDMLTGLPLSNYKPSKQMDTLFEKMVT